MDVHVQPFKAPQRARKSQREAHVARSPARSASAPPTSPGP
eukprot:CAMPEP_0171138444 /NCGR_PEP_ID=MMETSP0766_2-20121228/135101_1 /TAXON_ID=439317 /ORGANISM="Gambierdiscus australes, Strain CAWD 149" /LENGTH=40 /DNA_ID= /DNA_START= /DNA_END= /DNA_ORIENTATION=